MPLITLNTLSKIIQQKLNSTEKEAHQFAEIVMEIFGYDDSVIDNMLDHADRRLFYRLEAEGILSIRRDEVLLNDGTNWRIRYWEFQKTTIFSTELKKKERNIKTKNKNIPVYRHHDVYSSLPDTVWVRSRNPRHMNIPG